MHGVHEFSDTFNPVNLGIHLNLLCMADRASVLAVPDREVSLKAFPQNIESAIQCVRFLGADPLRLLRNFFA